MEMYVLDAQHQPVKCDDIRQWGEFLKTSPLRVIGRDTSGDVTVSTVFLGLDHRFTNTGEPVLWETMVFGGPEDGWQERYTSHDAALAGHQRAVVLARAHAGSAA